MPDGDIVRGKPGRTYQKPYKALSEGKATLGECTRSLLSSLKRDIQNKGNLPVVLAKRMGESLTNAVNNSGGVIFIDWTSLRQEFNKLADQIDGPPRLKELLLRAGRGILHDLQYGLEPDSSDPLQRILFRYMTEVYESGFRECIPPDADGFLIERLKQLELEISPVIKNWAKKAGDDGNFKNLRLPPLKDKKEIDYEEDLLSEHNHNNSKKLESILESLPEDFQITDRKLKEYLDDFNGASL